MNTEIADQSFIEVFENALSVEDCQQMIQRFEAKPTQISGQIGQAIDKKKKDSHDLCISESSDWVDLNQRIVNTTVDKLVQYVRKYPFLVCGALTPTMQFPNGEYMDLSSENIDQISDEQLKSVVLTFYRPGMLNLQKYDQGTGGYHHWHSEIHPRESNCETLHRVLLFMFFLNDVDEGGQTDFFYQQQQIRPKTGRMVIAPAGFTHTHKGHVPISSAKYIVTSWIMFQRAEHLFAVA